MAIAAEIQRDLLRGVVTQWTPGIKPTWTVSEIRTALREHASGNFSLSAQLVDTMGEDDELPGALEKYVDSVLGSDFHLDAVDEPNRQLSTRLVNQLGPGWWDMFPESELDPLIRWYRMLGVAVATIDWETGPAKWTGRLRVLHPQFLRWDSAGNRFLFLSEQGELEVTPGDGRWVLITDGQQGWMRAGVRALAITWISKQLAIRDWNRYNERHGLPIIKAMAPAIADDEDREQFWEDVQSIQSEIVAQLPTHLNDKGAAFDLELLEAKDQSWQTFPKLLERCDRKIQIYLLGANLAAEVVDQGARATADVHRGVERAKATAVAKKLSTSLREQALFPMVAVNATVPLAVIPWPCWDTSPPEDDIAHAEAIGELGNALAQLKTAGYEVEEKSLEELQERFGVKFVKAPAPEPLTPPEAVPAPRKPANPDNPIP